jgi:SecD/SecF fusion protein
VAPVALGSGRGLGLGAVLVSLLAGGAGCGGGDQEPSRETPGGVRLTYEGVPAPRVEMAAALTRSAEIMRKRLAASGLKGATVSTVRGDRIVVTVPGLTRAAGLAAARQIGQAAQLRFYDWETNVMGPGCKAAPTDTQVTGGVGSGNAATGLPLFDAVQLAAECPARNGKTATTTGARYLLDTKTRRVTAVERSRKAARPDERVVEVKPGTVIVRAEAPVDAKKPVDRWYVLDDDPALTGADIENPAQNFDSGPGGSGEPIVTFDFTSRGRRVWQDVTREIAQRGQSNAPPGNNDGITGAQHFAMVLDNELISVPYINYRENPDGIDAANGSQIQGGFTIRSARDLTSLLKAGALPIELELISVQAVAPSPGS